jgi:hypothetical protein
MVDHRPEIGRQRESGGQPSTRSVVEAPKAVSQLLGRGRGGPDVTCVIPRQAFQRVHVGLRRGDPQRALPWLLRVLLACAGLLLFWSIVQWAHWDMLDEPQSESAGLWVRFALVAIVLGLAVLMTVVWLRRAGSQARRGDQFEQIGGGGLIALALILLVGALAQYGHVDYNSLNTGVHLYWYLAFSGSCALTIGTALVAHERVRQRRFLDAVDSTTVARQLRTGFPELESEINAINDRYARRGRLGCAAHTGELIRLARAYHYSYDPDQQRFVDGN